MWAGLLTICCSPNWDDMASILEPSEVVVSPAYQLLDFVLKSPIVKIKKGLVAETASRVSSKLLQKFSKSFLDRFGDLYRETKLQVSKVIHSFKK